MYKVAQVLALAVLLALGAAMGAMAQAVVNVPNDDPEMAQAQAKARATLSHFWKVVEKPGAGEEGFALKVALPYGPGNSEHIWVTDLERKGGKIFGTINNEPRHVKTMRQGQRIAMLAEP